MADPKSYETKTGDGVTTIFTFNFPYLQEGDIEVVVDDILKTAPADYDFASPNQIEFVTAPAVDAVIVIRRDSIKNGRLVDYQSSSLTEQELDTDSLQAFYAAEEAKDTTNQAAEQAAQSAAAQALAARDKAQDWAEEAEDVEVDPGAYSAKHHAIKAAASAAAAAVFDPQSLYPVGSLYFNGSVATNPATLLGFGTWEAFAAGQVLLGVGSFNDGKVGKSFTLGQQDGEYEHKLVAAEMPVHTVSTTAARRFGSNGPSGSGWGSDTGSSGTATINSNPVGGDTPHNNMQPSIAVYIWRRTA